MTTAPLVTGRQRARARKLVTVLGDNLRLQEPPPTAEELVERGIGLLRPPTWTGRLRYATRLGLVALTGRNVVHPRRRPHP